MELRKFHEDKLDRSNNSSFLELIFSPKNYQKSNYTLSEWEDICTNLKSSLVFMEQIIVSIYILCFKMYLIKLFFLENEYYISSFIS